VIVVEASLNFLGLGLPPPQPTWGGMINEGRPYMENQPYLLFVPSACIVLTVVSLTVIGERLRGRLEDRTSEVR
jgi:peptide/nickel transport system permease protein